MRQNGREGAPVSQEPHTAQGIAEHVRAALESEDLAHFSELLDPDVRWGAPGDATPSCQNRDQVLAWYRRGQEAGTTARVTELLVLDDKILVGLMVLRQGEYAERWQILTIGPGGVTDIRGFEDRRSAASFVEI
jgi:hypothetical protein